jgi:diacylglycerol kinase family enzyme
MLTSVKTAALIVNPFSSRVSETGLRAVEEALAPFAQIETVQTSGRGHASELARELAERHEALLVFSGDGVFNEVLNGIKRPVPLGFIPGGRTNVLPRALGLPRNPVAAADRIGRALQEGRTKTISLGRANGRRFAFAAGVGADAELIRRIDERGRAHDGRLPGDIAVGWLLARQFAAHRGRYDPVLEIEGLGRAAFALVANGDTYTFAGPFPLRFAADARFELGLDVIAPVSLRTRTLPAVALRSLLGRTRGAGYLYGHDLDRIAVVCDRPLPLQVDGEDLGDVTEVQFECERGAAKVLL